MKNHKTYEIQTWSADGYRSSELTAILEVPLTIFVNGREVVTLLCTGKHPRQLAIGFLKSDAWIKHPDDLAGVEITIESERILAEVKVNGDPFAKHQPKRAITSGCGKGTNFERNLETIAKRRIDTQLSVTPEQINALAHELHERSVLYKKTRGCHNSSLCTPNKMLVFREDIGRHNAIDMIVGHCFLKGISTTDKMIVTTGRVASEILLKAVRIGVPVLASGSRATSMSVELARKTGITLIGDAGTDRMIIYNAAGRLEGL